MTQTAPTAITMNERYQRGLAEFKQRCTDNEVITEFINELFDQNLFNIRSTLATTEQPWIADIGCGDGTISSHLIKTLIQHDLQPNKYVVVEPEHHYLKLTEKRLTHVQDHFNFLSFENSKAEKYFTRHTLNLFHFIFASHSLHLISLDTLYDILNSLTPKGYLVVVIGAKTSIMSHLKNLFVSAPAITGFDILTALQTRPQHKLDINMLSYPSQLDLSDIMLPNNMSLLSENAKNLISLMIQKNIDEIKQEDYLTARQMILSYRLGSKLILENDCLIVKKA